MRPRYQVIGALVSLAFVVGLLGACGPKPEPPQVGEISVEPSTTILVGESASLMITATASGQDLQFKWTASSGSFSDPTAPSVIYTAPGSPGPDVVTVEVTGKGGTAVQSITLEIVEPPTPTPTLTPSPTPTETPLPTETPTAKPTDTPLPTEIPTETPTIPVSLSPHPIYMGTEFAEGYDMGVDTSGGLTDWVTNVDGHMCMAYPGGQTWGAVFITFGEPTDPPRPGKDLSSYQTLSLELRGEAGGEYVWIGLKDNTDPDNGTETKEKVKGLTTEWQPKTFPLSDFRTADLSRLYVVTEFVFELGTPSETICFRNIQFLP